MDSRRSDVPVLFATRIVRLFAYGALSVVLVLDTSGSMAENLRFLQEAVLNFVYKLEEVSFEVVRRCRGAEYRIRVTNRATGRAATLVVDGQAIEGTLVPYAPAGKVVTIACEV